MTCVDICVKSYNKSISDNADVRTRNLWYHTATLDSPAVHGLPTSLTPRPCRVVRRPRTPSRPWAGFRGRTSLPSPCVGSNSHPRLSHRPRPPHLARSSTSWGRSTPKDPLSTVGAFLRSAVSPLRRNVTAGRGPRFPTADRYLTATLDSPVVHGLPRPSLLDLAGSFNAPGPPLDRGQVSAVGRRSPRPVWAPTATPTLPPSTASPRRSFLDLVGSFDAPRPALDRGPVTAVGRRSPRSPCHCRWRARFPRPTGLRFPPGPNFRAPMRCLRRWLSRGGVSGARGCAWPVVSSCWRGGGIFSVPAARVRVRLEPSLHAQRIAPTPIHGGARSTACPGSDLRRARMPSSRHGLRGHLHPTFSTHDSSHQVASRWTVSRITTVCVCVCVCVCDRPVLPCTLSSLFPQHPLGVEYSTSTRPVGFPVLVSRSFSHNSTHSRSVHRCAALSCIFFTGSDPSLPDLGRHDSHLGLGLALKSMPSSDPTSSPTVDHGAISSNELQDVSSPNPVGEVSEWATRYMPV